MKKISDLSKVPAGFSAFTVTHQSSIMIVFRNNKKRDDCRPFATINGFYLFKSVDDVKKVLDYYGYQITGELPQ